MHTLSFLESNPLHIDCTFVIIGPGLVIVNPERPCQQADMFLKAGWKVLYIVLNACRYNSVSGVHVYSSTYPRSQAVKIYTRPGNDSNKSCAEARERGYVNEAIGYTQCVMASLPACWGHKESTFLLIRFSGSWNSIEVFQNSNKALVNSLSQVLKSPCMFENCSTYLHRLTQFIHTVYTLEVFSTMSVVHCNNL